MLKIRRPLGRLIFNMEIAIPGKTVFLIVTAPWCFQPTRYWRNDRVAGDLWRHCDCMFPMGLIRVMTEKKYSLFSSMCLGVDEWNHAMKWRNMTLTEYIFLIRKWLHLVNYHDCPLRNISYRFTNVVQFKRMALSMHVYIWVGLIQSRN